MKRFIATITNSDFGLVEEQEYVGNTDITEAFYQFGWLKPYDDTLPLPPKGINDYEPGLTYPPSRYIIMDGHIYKSNSQTSTTWDENEWDLKI